MQRKCKIIQAHDWMTGWESGVSGREVLVFTCGMRMEVGFQVLGDHSRMTISCGVELRLEV